MDYRQLPVEILASWLEEIEHDLNYFRAPVSVRNPESGAMELYTLPERLAAHLNPHCDPDPRTPVELMRDAAELSARLALTQHSQAPGGAWCGTCFETWPCAYVQRKVS